MSEQFDEQGNGFEIDDVEAHRIPDHMGRDLDVEGHLEVPESPRRIDLDEDDVEGHVQPPRDADGEGQHGMSVQPPRDADNSGTQF